MAANRVIGSGPHIPWRIPGEQKIFRRLTEGKVLAKTGYVGKARNLSGYVTTRDGETMAFILLMNHYNGETSTINTVQDSICEILAGSSR